MKPKAETRVYVVEVKGQVPRLVRASHPLNALRHVSGTLLAVRHASQDRLIELLQAGVKVEEPGDDPEARQPEFPGIGM